MRLLKDNGNGGYNIPKGTFALILCIIALLSSIVTVVAYGVTIKADVEYLKTAVDKIAIDNPDYKETTNQKFNQHENAIIVNQERIIAMHEDIIEIKSDVKELLSR